MRTATLALLAGFTLGVVAPVQAADLDYGVLRGPDYEPAETLIDWNGVYVGGHGGYTSAEGSASNRFSAITSSVFTRAGTNENSSFSNSAIGASGSLLEFERRAGYGSFGGYAGFNYQFDETVVGLEIDYTKFDKSIISNSSTNFVFLDPTTNNTVGINMNGLSSTKIVDYGTIRARGGYVIGNFLPFLTGGLAIGRAEISDQVNIKDSSTTNSVYDRRISETSFGKNSSAVFGNYVKTKVVAGLALGAGLEYALTSNIILRAEYQYVLFNDFDGHKVNLNTVRGGAAVKF